AMDYAARGAQWLHVVDLAGARDGQNGIAPLLKSVCRGGLRVQVGGGIRSETDVADMFNLGVERVVVGSVAVREPERVIGWLTRFGAERMVLAFDVRQSDEDWYVTSEGWTRSESITLKQLARRYVGVGVRHVLCTDISRDGMLSGPNLALYENLRRLA